MPRKPKADARQPYTGGHESHRRRGLVGVMVPVTPEVRELLRKAAALADPPGPVSRYAARVLEDAARRTLAAAGLPDNPKNPSC